MSRFLPVVPYRSGVQFAFPPEATVGGEFSVYFGMDTQMRKYSLIQAIVNLENLKILEQLEALIEASNSEKTNWWNELSEAQKTGIDVGIAQSDSGETCTYKEIRAGIQQKFGV